MSDLSPELRQLVLAGRLAARPTDADLERVLSGLQARLGVTAGLAGGAMVASVSERTTSALATRTIGLAAVGLALVVGSIAVVTTNLRGMAPGGANAGSRPAAGALSQPATGSELTAADQTALSSLNVAPATPLTDANTAPIPTSSHGANRARDNLSEEVAILTRAETELHAGRAESALRFLNEHARRFRNGILAEERTAARIQALCALNRVAEADAQRARLSPQSLHGEPARQACGSQQKRRSVR